MTSVCRVVVAVCVGRSAVWNRRRPRAASAPQPPATDARTAAAAEAASRSQPRSRRSRRTYEETVVVSASRTEEKLLERAGDDQRHQGADDPDRAVGRTSPSCCAPFPASTSRRCQRATSTSRAAPPPARWRPGSSRCSTAAALYQDFFGFVMWDFLPVNLNEIKQVEVIRGPASAVWGANALNGVVNVITKTPREIKGTSGTFGFGGFDRRRTHDAGTRLLHQRHARASAETIAWSFKISAGGYTQDRACAADRTDSLRHPEVCTSRRPTIRLRQHRHDAAEVRRARGLRLPGRPEAVVLGRRCRHRRHHAHRHRPVRHQQRLGDGLRQGELHAQGASRPASSPTSSTATPISLLTRRPERQADHSSIFDTKTFDFDASNVQTFAKRHVLTYGGNLRFNGFDLSLAPDADNRTEVRRLRPGRDLPDRESRLVAGGRVDRFDFLDDFVFSPRVAFALQAETRTTRSACRTTRPIGRRR